LPAITIRERRLRGTSTRVVDKQLFALGQMQRPTAFRARGKLIAEADVRNVRASSLMIAAAGA